jgi:Predicted periplasmic lipoprotein involved in iron transport
VAQVGVSPLGEEHHVRWRSAGGQAGQGPRRPCNEDQVLEIAPKAVARGAGELIEEVSDGKINGEEDRYSHTDLSDFDANQVGSKQAYSFLEPIVRTKDKALATATDQGFAAVEGSLEPYEVTEGVFKPFTSLTPADKATMQSKLAVLSENLAKVPAVIGVS